MLKHILIRIIWMFIMLFVIISIVFFLAEIAMWKRYHLPIPFGEFMTLLSSRYVDFIHGVLTEWDWGMVNRHRTAWDLLLFKAPKTLYVNLLAFGFSLVAGITLGIISAIKRNTVIDHVIGFLVHIMGAIPNFIWIFPLMILFGYYLRWVQPYPPATDFGAWESFKAMLLPAFALSLLPIAKFTSLIRGELSEAFYSNYVLLLKAKGMNTRQIISRHLFKDSIVAIIPSLTPTFMFVIASSFLLEQINNIQGVSFLLYQALFGAISGGHMLDINVPAIVMACAFYVTFGMIIGLMADIGIAMVDPRVRIGSGKKVEFDV